MVVRNPSADAGPSVNSPLHTRFCVRTVGEAEESVQAAF